MARTLTTTAYAALPKAIHAGVNSISFDFTVAAGAGNSLSASANATILLGPKIPNGATILDITGQHSSGAATMPVDIGIDASLSKFASQKTLLTRATVAGINLPFKVSVTENASAQYRTITFGVTPGTDTAASNFKYTVLFTQDP
jgi:hypothetical protein